jgi:hypothetical protein
MVGTFGKITRILILNKISRLVMEQVSSLIPFWDPSASFSVTAINRPYSILLLATPWLPAMMSGSKMKHQISPFYSAGVQPKN